jgi:hypothetical protein
MMNCAYDKEMLTRLLTGELEEKERVLVIKHLETCPDCQKEYAGLKKIWSLLGEAPVPAPSDSMQTGFQAILQNYSRETVAGPGWLHRLGNALQRRWHLQPRLPLAVGLFLLLTGLGAGYMLTRPGPEKEDVTEGQVRQLTMQVREMKQEMMVNGLADPSASERIKAVSYTDGISNANRQVADALLTTLNNDPNVNVRLVTLEALVKFAKEPYVREGLIQSIGQQDSPLMQSAIADVMVKLQERRSVRSLQELLQKKDINEMVRKKIEQSIHRLI